MFPVYKMSVSGLYDPDDKSTQRRFGLRFESKMKKTETKYPHSQPELFIEDL
jgi:hypothetical protein